MTARIEPILLIWTVLLIPLTEGFEYIRRHPEVLGRRPQWVVWVGDYAMFFVILLTGRFTAQEFVYFQF